MTRYHANRVSERLVYQQLATRYNGGRDADFERRVRELDAVAIR